MPIPHSGPARSGIVWKITPTEGIIKPLRAWQEQKIRALESRVAHTSGAITRWMQQNAEWQDRTGRARKSLFTRVTTDKQAHIITVTLSYKDVPYDTYLENMQGGRFSILGPALDYWGERILKLAKETILAQQTSITGGFSESGLPED